MVRFGNKRLDETVTPADNATKTIQMSELD